MANVQFDGRGLKCPLPVLKLTQKLMKKEFNDGDIVDVLADCPTFEKDIKDWCTQWKKVMLWIRNEGGHKHAQIKI